MSLDGYIDDRSDQPLRLSGDADIDRVDELRASSDAILVGAGTIRADDPVLLLRSQARRDARVARGVEPRSGEGGDQRKRGTSSLARGCSRPARIGSSTYRQAALAGTRDRLGGKAQTSPTRAIQSDLNHILDDLAIRGVARLMVEGGASVLTPVPARRAGR